jgi:hypothetical protein
MLAYNSGEFRYLSEDKGLDFSGSAFEDSTNDLFNQYINHDPPDPSDNVNKANFSEAYEFSLGDGTRKTFGDQAFHTNANPTLRRSRRFAPTGLRCTQSQEILPSQIYQKVARFEAPKPAISGVELLKLEGKVAPQTVPVMTSFSHSPHMPVPPLRRKARFSANPPETLRYRHHKVSKGPGVSVGESSKMMRPSYYCRGEMPSFHEWTQQLEQISLQTSVTNLPLAHPSSDGLPRADDVPRNLPNGRSSLGRPRLQQVPDRKYQPMIGNSMSDIAERPLAEIEKLLRQSLATTSGGEQDTNRHDMESVAGLSVQSRQSSSSLQAASRTESSDFPLSPSQMQSSVLSASTCYYGNFGATRSAPALHQTRSRDFSAHSVIYSDEPFDHFVTEDPSHDYFITSDDAINSPQVDVYPPLPSPPLPCSPRRPRTPPPPSASACPSPAMTPTSKSPAKPHRQSKSSRRKGSAGTQKSPTSMDFVNFTPSDSDKILSGVAPSGSSKTKARREQEAIEKKRKLSSALERVVKEVGGDMEQLRAAGILED